MRNIVTFWYDFSTQWTRVVNSINAQDLCSLDFLFFWSLKRVHQGFISLKLFLKEGKNNSQETCLARSFCSLAALRVALFIFEEDPPGIIFFSSRAIAAAAACALAAEVPYSRVDEPAEPVDYQTCVTDALFNHKFTVEEDLGVT